MLFQLNHHYIVEGHHGDDLDDGPDDMTRQDDGHAHYNTLSLQPAGTGMRL